MVLRVDFKYLLSCNMFFQMSIFCILLSGATSKSQFDSCDWKKSGLIHSAASREIENVQLSCESGRLEWMYPTTALQIVFQYPHSTADFTACFLPDVDFSGASLLHRGKVLPSNGNTFGQPTGLHVIYGDPDVKDTKRENTEHDITDISCVNSTYGKLKMILMATAPRVDISRKVAALKYELYPINKHKTRPEHKKHRKKVVNERKMMFSGGIEDCRPCTSDEILDLYCSSDFVARGHVLSVEDETRHKWTNLEFLAEHVIKETPSDWPLFRSPLVVPGLNLSRIPSSDGEKIAASPKRLRELSHGIFHVPAQCGFRPPHKDHIHFNRDYVIMGNYNFGGGWVECFPKWKDLVSIIENWLDRNDSPRRHTEYDCDYELITKTQEKDKV